MNGEEIFEGLSAHSAHILYFINYPIMPTTWKLAALTLLFYVQNPSLRWVMASHMGRQGEFVVGGKATRQRDGHWLRLHCQDGIVVVVMVNVMELLVDDEVEMAVDMLVAVAAPWNVTIVFSIEKQQQTWCTLDAHLRVCMQ